MNTLKLFTCIAIIFIACAANAFADVKIKIRTTTSGQTYENTTYIKGKRQRAEQSIGAVKTATLTQCDLRRDVNLNLQAKTFMITAYGEAKMSEPQAGAAAKKTSKPEKGGVVTTIVTTRDTGERKQMFGYTARRVLTTMTSESSPDACSVSKNQMEIDGWYIDAEFAFDCGGNNFEKFVRTDTESGCNDRQVFKQNGTAKTGYPVYQKTTMKMEGGVEFTSVQEVLEISKAVLEDSLFEIPKDFREVKNSGEFYAGSAGMQTGSASKMPNVPVVDDEDNEDSETENRASNKNAPPANFSANTGAKKAGTIRFGLVEVKTGATGDGMNAANLSAAMRNTLVEYLKSSNIEIVEIESKLSAQIAEEAKQKSVDFVIFATVSHKKGGGGFGKMFGKIAPVIAGSIPGAERSVEANRAINMGRDAIYTAGDLAENVKAKDELTVEITLKTPENSSAAFSKQFKAKAKNDGEDLVSPLVEQAAGAIIAAAKK
jgi:hypothetical protein